MNQVLNYFLSSVAISTSNLKLKNLIVNKPWVWVDENTAKAKFIFKRNGTLVVSITGNALNGNWEYLSGAKSIHIDSEAFSFLLNEIYLDENILLFKKDASDDQLLVFCNETAIPDLNAQNYLNEVYCTHNSFKMFPLYGEKNLLIHGYINENSKITGSSCQIVDNELQDLKITEGRFLSADRYKTFYIKNGIVEKVLKNTILSLEDGSTIEIGITDTSELITRFGNNVPDGEYIFKTGIVYTVENSLLKHWFQKNP